MVRVTFTQNEDPSFSLVNRNTMFWFKKNQLINKKHGILPELIKIKYGAVAKPGQLRCCLGWPTYLPWLAKKKLWGRGCRLIFWKTLKYHPQRHFPWLKYKAGYGLDRVTTIFSTMKKYITLGIVNDQVICYFRNRTYYRLKIITAVWWW